MDENKPTAIPVTDITSASNEPEQQAPAPMDVIAPQPTTEPVNTQPIAVPQDVQPATPEAALPTTVVAVSTEAPAAVQPEAVPTPAQQVPAEPSPQITAHASGGNHHIIAIVVGLIVMLALLGAIGYLYMQKNKTSITTTESKTTSQETAKPAVTAADVDNTSKAVDDSLQKIDADKDFSTNDLSDATLGL